MSSFEESGAWHPLDPKNAIGLHFESDEMYQKASTLAHGIQTHEIRFPGRNSILINRNLQTLFDEFKGSYVEEKVTDSADVPNDTMRKLRRKWLFGSLD